MGLSYPLHLLNYDSLYLERKVWSTMFDLSRENSNYKTYFMADLHE